MEDEKKMKHTQYFDCRVFAIISYDVICINFYEHFVNMSIYGEAASGRARELASEHSEKDDGWSE